MKQLIKAAITYKATIPTDITVLEQHLAERKFAPCQDYEASTMGFVPPVEHYSDLLVAGFPGGFAFRVRIDEKVLPASAIKAELEAKLKDIERETGWVPRGRAKQEIKAQVVGELTRRALVKTKASVTCYYDVENQHLIVPTTSQKIADAITSLLIHVVGSVKTETVTVSDIKLGLTTRMKQWIEQDDATAFGAFDPCDEVALASDNRKITVKMTSLQQARQGIAEALRTGFGVKSIGFHYDGADFKLTDDFRLKGIALSERTIEEEEESMWEGDAAMQVGKVSQIVNALVELLSYKEAAQ